MGKRMEIKKICKFCGEPFIAQKTTTRYCSHRCNSRAYKLRKKGEKISMPKKFNLGAGIPFAKAKEIERISEEYEKMKNKEFLSVKETAFLLSVGRTTIYRYLHEGILKAVQMNGKTFIRRSDIDNMFDEAEKYQSKATPNTEPLLLTEFYTVAEIKEKYNIKETWLYKVAKENNIPKTLAKGKSLFSKIHIDKYFEKKGYGNLEHINEWYSVEDIMKNYGMTTSAIYNFVSKKNIPRKKEGRNVLYSKHDFDAAKGAITTEYYSTAEAMEKYGLTRDALYHYIKYHNIPKIKEGRYIKISKAELDSLFNPQITT